MDDYGNFDIIDIINIMSFIVGIQNLELNNKQVESLSKEMTENQDIMLKIIINQNNEIIKLLKEYKNDKN